MNLLALQVPVLWKTVVLLSLSNVFMTFAWYAHLKNLADRPWWIAALISWGIALFEYPRHTQVNHKWTNYSLTKSAA